MRRDGLALGVAALLLLGGCGATYVARAVADQEAYMAYLAERPPFGVERECPSRAPRVELVRQGGWAREGVQLWLSSPTRTDANRYVVTFPESTCDVVIQQKVSRYSNGALEHPTAYREVEVIANYRIGYSPPEEPEGYERLLSSAELELALRDRLRSDCADPNSDDCAVTVGRWFDTRTISVTFSPVDLPEWMNSQGHGRGDVTLDLVDGRAYWEGQPL